MALLLALLLAASAGLAASAAPAARPLAAALLVRAGAGFRVAAREPAPAGETPWDEEAEGRRLGDHSVCEGSCDDGARRRTLNCNYGYMRRRDLACYFSCDLNCPPPPSPPPPPPSGSLGQREGDGR